MKPYWPEWYDAPIPLKYCFKLDGIKFFYVGEFL